MFKTYIHKISGEWVHIEINVNLKLIETFTSCVPTLLPDTHTVKNFQEYLSNLKDYHNVVEWDNIELINVKIEKL